ncbi:DUF3987 domain-containing protein [Mangrovibacter sp. SLW1]
MHNLQHYPRQKVPCPVDAFPDIMKDAIVTLHEDTHLPVEMISSTILAAAALTCQGFIDVLSPYGNVPEPCSLYFLTLADSSEGKSTLYHRIMSPFESFADEMKAEYQEKQKDYIKHLTRWKVKESALKSALRKAIRDGDSDEEAFFSEQLDAHQDNRSGIHGLKQPGKFNLIYEDVAFRALMDGLRDQPSAAVFSSEAITFFKGRLKSHLGLLNKAWGGEVYSYHRADEDDTELKARLTLMLLVQPGTFDNYLRNNGKEAGDSGFLSRFLFTRTHSTQGTREGNLNYDKSNAALNKFHNRVSELLQEQKDWFRDTRKPRYQGNWQRRPSLSFRKNRKNTSSAQKTLPCGHIYAAMSVKLAVRLSELPRYYRLWKSIM